MGAGYIGTAVSKLFTKEGCDIIINTAVALVLLAILIWAACMKMENYRDSPAYHYQH